MSRMSIAFVCLSSLVLGASSVCWVLIRSTFLFLWGQNNTRICVSVRAHFVAGGAERILMACSVWLSPACSGFPLQLFTEYIRSKDIFTCDVSLETCCHVLDLTCGLVLLREPSGRFVHLHVPVVTRWSHLDPETARQWQVAILLCVDDGQVRFLWEQIL